MVPCIVFAGPVGLGFGYMGAEGNSILPSISPALSGMVIIIFLIVLRRSKTLMIPSLWTDILKDKDVHEFFSLLLPATIS
ncbi:hypothetical protein NMG60_11026641 [Bertholletia excelsa]